MVLATIIYDPSGGSDTAASGSNSPTTAYTSAADEDALASTISVATSSTLTFSVTVNLTNVADDSSDVIWVNTPDGDRSLFRITSYTGGKASCTAIVSADLGDAIATGLSWAIGGKRKTPYEQGANQPVDFDDGKSGWIFSLEDGATYAFPSRTGGHLQPVATGTSTDGPLIIQAASGASPALTWADGEHFLEVAIGLDIRLDGLSMINSTSTSLGNRWAEAGSNSFHSLDVRNCTIQTYGLVLDGNAGRNFFLNCDIRSTNAIGIDIGGSKTQTTILLCIIHNCGSHGIQADNNGQQGGLVVRSCVIRDNGGAGININSVKHYIVDISNSTLHANTQDGISLAGTLNVDHGPTSIVNNILTSNGQYGIASDSGDISGGMLGVFEDYNAFWDNTSGRVFQMTEGANDVTLSVDPYTDSANDDYSLNATAGGGAACRDVGFGRTS